MKLRFAIISLLAVTGLVWAEDVDDSYAALKDAVEKKDVDAVMKLAPETAKQAAALAAKPQPSDAAAVENWKARVGFGKEVGSYAEYALSALAATAEPAKAIELVDVLIEVNPKSQYLSNATPVYLAALLKERRSDETTCRRAESAERVACQRRRAVCSGERLSCQRPRPSSRLRNPPDRGHAHQGQARGHFRRRLGPQEVAVSGPGLLRCRRSSRANLVLEGLRYQPSCGRAVCGKQPGHCGNCLFLPGPRRITSSAN